MKRSELEQLIISHIKDANSEHDLMKLMGYVPNGSTRKVVKDIIRSKNLDVSHFGPVEHKRIHQLVTKKCLVCDNEFVTSQGAKKEKTYCSKSCSNVDRIMTEETKEKIRLQLMSPEGKYQYLLDRYGKEIIETALENRRNGMLYEEIRETSKMTINDMKVLFNLTELNYSGNTFKAKNVTSEKVNELYLLHKNLKKVAKILKISYQTTRKLLDDSLMVRKDGKAVSQRVGEWIKRKKQQLVEYKGGCCENCGYDRSIWSLQFHHINPKEKDFTISGKTLALERLKVEADKCVLVCANCHGEIHEQLKNEDRNDIVNNILQKRLAKD